MGTYRSLCKMFLLKCFALILPLVYAKNLTQHVEHICLEAGTMSKADTDDAISATLHGSSGHCETFELGYSHYNDFEKGAYDCYGRNEGLGGCTNANLGTLEWVSVHIGGSDGWFCVKARVGERDCYFNKWLMLMVLVVIKPVKLATSSD